MFFATPDAVKKLKDVLVEFYGGTGQLKQDEVSSSLRFW